MSRISDLTAEQDAAQQRLADHRAQLDAQRRKITPDRAEQGRLRELVDEDVRELQAITEDLDFERERMASGEQIAARAAARAKRDAALKTYKTTIGSAWLSIENKMRALTAEAAALRDVTNRAAKDLTAVAWTHYSDASRASTASGQVTDIVLGDHHVQAVALMLEDFVRALPANIQPRLFERFGIELVVRSPSTAGATVQQANVAAHRLLSARCTEWMAEVEHEKAAA